MDFLLSLIPAGSAAVTAFIKSYGYLALFFLMTLEGTGLPVASEVVLPLAGLLSEQGTLSIIPAFLSVFLGNIAGTLIAYYVGYFLGKEVIYRHLKFFRIRQETLDSFDRWFERNGSFAVFISRLIPEVRGLMGFPAGFAKMPIKKYITYSAIGTFIWDAVLFAFGFYLISSNSVTVLLISIGAFGLILFLIYTIAVKRIRKSA